MTLIKFLIYNSIMLFDFAFIVMVTVAAVEFINGER